MKTHIACFVALLICTNLIAADSAPPNPIGYILTFKLVPPSPPTLRISRQSPSSVLIGVSSRPGQLIVLEQSADLRVWSAVVTNLSVTGSLGILLASRCTGWSNVQVFTLARDLWPSQGGRSKVREAWERFKRDSAT